MIKRTKSRVRGVSLYVLPTHRDERGSLIAGEFESQIGFAPKRYFMVFDVPGMKIRGQHAHRKCRQFLICVKGTLNVQVTDGVRKQTYTLNRLNVGLSIPPMVWCVHYNYRPGTILLVFASHHYDPSNYVRNYDDYLRRVKRKVRRAAP